MNPASLVPVAQPVPIPWAWFDVLLILTFVAHILFMNALLGSAFIGMTRLVRGHGSVARAVGQKLPPILALTINLGVAPLLFLQVNYGHFDYVSSVLMGGWWLFVIPVLIAAYYGFYTYKFRYDVMNPALRSTIFGASILGLLYVGFMLSNNMTLMLRPEGWMQYFEGGGGFLNWGDRTLYPRFLHFMVGTVAVGGLFVALLGHWKKNGEFVEIGMTWFLRATVVNMAAGIWFLMSLPGEMMLDFMGRNMPATLTFASSLLSVAVLMYHGLKKNPVQAAVWAGITVFFMACNRHWVRTFSLDPYFRIETTPVTGQYGSFFLFLGFLVAGLALCGYMLKLYFKSRQGRA